MAINGDHLVQKITISESIDTNNINKLEDQLKEVINKGNKEVDKMSSEKLSALSKQGMPTDLPLIIMSKKNLIEDLINALTCLPGVGTKTAQRMTYFLLQRAKDDALNLSDVLKETVLKTKTVNLVVPYAKGIYVIYAQIRQEAMTYYVLLKVQLIL